jgi:hypothetical protein
MVYGMISYMVETLVMVDVHGWHMEWYKIHTWYGVDVHGLWLRHMIQVMVHGLCMDWYMCWCMVDALVVVHG